MKVFPVVDFKWGLALLPLVFLSLMAAGASAAFNDTCVKSLGMNYTVVDNWSSPANYYDGNWATGTAPSGASANYRYIYSVYDLTGMNASASKWQVKDGGGQVNITLNSSCSVDSNLVHLRAATFYQSATPVTGYHTAWECWNVSAWIRLRFFGTDNTVFEDCMTAFADEAPPAAVPTSMTLLMEGTGANRTVTYGASVNFTAYVNVTGLNVSLYIDDQLINNGTTRIENASTAGWFVAGTYKITANTTGNTSFATSNATWYLTVSKVTPNVFGYESGSRITSNISGFVGLVPYVFNSSGTIPGGSILTYGIQVNGTDQGANATVTLGVYQYNFTFYTEGNANYTANSTTWWLSASRPTLATVAVINGTGDTNYTAVLTVPYGSTINLTAYTFMTTAGAGYGTNPAVYINVTTNSSWGNFTNKVSPYTNISTAPTNGTWYFKTESVNAINYTTGLMYGIALVVQAPVLYSPPTLSGEIYASVAAPNTTEDFNIDATFLGNVSLTNMTFTYNDTVYVYDSFVNSSDVLTFYKSITTPAITEKTGNATFYWNLSYQYVNGTKGSVNTSSKVQYIWYTSLVACGVESNTTAIYLYSRNETSLADENATMNIWLYSSDGSSSYTYNATVYNTTHRVCIFPANSSFRVSGQVQYYKNDTTGYAVRNYYFQNDVYNSSSAPVYLHQTPATDQKVKVTVKDQYNLPKPDVVVRLQRWYPAEYTWRTVEGELTDDQGDSTFYMTLYTVRYRFLVYNNGAVIGTYGVDRLTATELIIGLSESTITDYIKLQGVIVGSAGYSTATGYITASYRDKSATYLVNATLRVWETGALTDSLICTSVNTTLPSGTLRCYVGNYTGKVFRWELISNATTGTFPIASGLLNDYSTSRLFGNCENISSIGQCKEGLVITFFITLTAALIGIWRPTMSIMFMLMALAASTWMGLLAISVMVVISTVFVGLVAIFIIRDRGD